MTQEQIKRVNDNFEYLCKLRLNSKGELVSEEEYERDQQLQRQKQEEAQRKKEERDIFESWQRIDYDTLNTLIIKYKQNGDQLYFNQAWDKCLKDLTQSYLYRYVIKGLTVSAKRLFLVDHQNDQLQDVLYEVLLKAIDKWTPNMPGLNTRDFAAYYQRAVMNFSGNIINRCKRKKHQNISVQYIDFNDEEEINMLLLSEPSLVAHFQYSSGYDYIVMDQYIETFIKTHLSKEQAMLLGLMINERLPITEIAKYMKTSRKTVYEKWRQIKALWLAYDRY